MSFKAADSYPSSITRMEAFKLYALRKRFNITRSQKAFDRLNDFQNILVEKAVNSKVISRQDGGAASLSFKSEISADFVHLEMTAGQFLEFKKQVSVQVSMLFTKESKLPLVSEAEQSDSLLSMQKGIYVTEKFSAYQQDLHEFRQTQKELMRRELGMAGIYAAGGIVCAGGMIISAVMSYAKGNALFGAAAIAVAFVTGVPMFYLSARAFARSFAYLAKRIDEAAMQTAMTSDFKKF